MSSDPLTIMTTPTDGVEEDPLFLYEPIHEQIDPKHIPWKIEYKPVTPQQAQKYLMDADEYTKFGQRKRTPARKKRWLDLMESNRFVEYHPFGPLGFNEDGILMNGGNRLAALAAYSRPLGFLIIRNCPTWIINYIDNNQVRTAREAMFINLKDVTAETQALVRLGLRYEEFLFGKRSELGWIDWSKQRDEHIDLINWMNKREFVLDLIGQAKKVKKATDIPAPSVAAFIAYQQLAWPDGTEMLERFLDGLQLGVMLEKGNPALTLREWAAKDGFIGSYSRGRREGHLLLLMKYFTLFAEGHKIHEVRVARGLPMAMPYHPDGWDTACKNAREALLEMG